MNFPAFQILLVNALLAVSRSTDRLTSCQDTTRHATPCHVMPQGPASTTRAPSHSI